jgi:hypothetical protein
VVTTRCGGGGALDGMVTPTPPKTVEDITNTAPKAIQSPLYDIGYSLLPYGQSYPLLLWMAQPLTIPCVIRICHVTLSLGACRGVASLEANWLHA